MSYNIIKCVREILPQSVLWAVEQVTGLYMEANNEKYI